MTWEPGDRVGALSDADVARFLGEPWNARLATVAPDGWPHLTPVWYEYEPEGRAFLIVGRERAAWVAHVRREPRVALHVADDAHAEHTRVLVQGWAEIVEGPVAPASSPRVAALTRRLSLRYLGPDGPTYAARTAQRPRVLIRVAAEFWRTWTGREWHPRYR
ncbi:MAG TPA: TIGR03618 family F420-dependent PPOX class oxidoreductase [Methylomirabilota bacterium]|jgi:PPOX class probable F420-dependent enzyme|nr:TIGR03618 family F420-dependent PPOX class oxidoreductase [Methylomirabilota bacterium]